MSARVVMAALPVTGCVVHDRAEVEWLDDERGGAGWQETAVGWCVGRDAAARARELGIPVLDESRFRALLGGEPPPKPAAQESRL